MNLLILSYAFAPSIGGIETATLVLAERFRDAGNEVTVLTASPDPSGTFTAPYRVVRNPSRDELFALLGSADAIIQNNISLNFAWPLYLARLLKPFGVWRRLASKPLVTILQTYISSPEGIVGWQHKLKLFVLRYGGNYAVSDHLRRTLNAPSAGVMPNPYADQIFRLHPEVERTRPLLFVGRITAAKGCDTAIEALTHLHRMAAATGDEPLPLDVVGLGPDEPKLRQHALDLGLGDYVHFLGPRQGDALAKTMNEHTLLLVPSRSRPPEALGIVALEGIACGCVPVVSDQGGLPEAIGPCGLAFPEGDAEALATCIDKVLHDPAAIARFQAAAPAHLAQYTPSAVLAAYQSALEREGLGQTTRPV